MADLPKLVVMKFFLVVRHRIHHICLIGHPTSFRRGPQVSEAQPTHPTIMTRRGTNTILKASATTLS